MRMNKLKMRNSKYTADEVLKEIAKLSEKEIIAEDKEYLNKEKSIDAIFPPIEADQSFLDFAREYDKNAKKRNKLTKQKRILRTAAVFAVCIITIFAIAIETSDALRVRIYDIFSDKSEGSITLLPEAEKGLLGEWEDYWYPTYIPDGFQMVGAEKYADESAIIFENKENEAYFNIMEFSFDTVLSYDTDTNSMEAVRIACYQGYLFEDIQNQSIGIFWMTDDRQLSVNAKGKIDRETIIKIAEGLEYRK